MPRVRKTFKREFKGDITIGIYEIFRNEDVQNEAIKECKKNKKQKNGRFNNKSKSKGK